MIRINKYDQDDGIFVFFMNYNLFNFKNFDLTNI